MNIPKPQFTFGQKVFVTWHEDECPSTEAVITGIDYDHRRHKACISYAITEENGAQTDDITEEMLSAA